MFERALRQALALLQATRREFGQGGRPLWRQLQLLALDGRGRDWDEAVLIPVGLAQGFLQEHGLPEESPWADRVAALGAWDLTKGAYLFDGDLFEELIQAPLDRLPTELLRRLPEYAPLLLFPRPWEGAVGAWIFLEHDLRGTPHLEFRALLLMEDGRLIPLMLDLLEPDLPGCLTATLEETRRGVEQAAKVLGVGVQEIEEAMARFRGVLERHMRGLLGLALYLCSEEPDFSQSPPPLARTYRARGERLIDRPERAVPIQVGWRWGAALRQARSGSHSATGTGRSPAPHVRRGHWHLYWAGEGSRKDPSRRVPRVRWVHPTLVGAREGQELPVVVRKTRR